MRRAIAEGDCLFYEFIYVVPVLRVIPAFDCLWRVLATAGISWHEADHFQFGDGNGLTNWTLLDNEAFCLHSQFFRPSAGNDISYFLRNGVKKIVI